MYNKDEYLDSLKKRNHYRFSLPVQYVKKWLNDNNTVDGTVHMKVYVYWDAAQHGYMAKHRLPILFRFYNPRRRKEAEQEFWRETVYFEVVKKLNSKGIPAQAIAFFN